MGGGRGKGHERIIDGDDGTQERVSVRQCQRAIVSTLGSAVFVCKKK